jgi:hypothetical protein
MTVCLCRPLCGKESVNLTRDRSDRRLLEKGDVITCTSKQIAAELLTEAAPTALFLLSEPLPVVDLMHLLLLVDPSRDFSRAYNHFRLFRGASALALAKPLPIGARGARRPSSPKPPLMQRRRTTRANLGVAIRKSFDESHLPRAQFRS